MTRHNAIVASNILHKIEETQKVLDYLYKIEGENLKIRTDKCPHCISLPTIPLRESVYMLVKTFYEDEIKYFKNQLEQL